LELNGQVELAYARVNRLLAASRAGHSLPPDLRARMGWLQARLSFDVHDSEQTLKLIDTLLASLDGLAPPSLRAAIASNGELLKAEACFDLKREASALEILKKLRTDYPRADAAVSSYFVEAEHYAQQDKVVEAQQLLTRLADEFPKSPYAPYALYQAAYLAERLGQDDNLQEANRLIERLVNAYPDQDIVFDARLKQGDLLRKLNQFPQAQQAYESLINNYARNPNVILADLALAECHNAQSASDPSHEETARSLFEDLCARVDASVDVRAEAGYNLGLIYQRRGQLDRAKEVWWRDVVTALLLDPQNAARLEGKGRYWMSRTLYEYGALLQRMGHIDQAEQAWRDIIRFNLSGQALARANLARLGGPPDPPAAPGK
jgi:TolA-binding protein